MRLDAADGMILWIGIDPTADDYLGLGVEVKIEKIIEPRQIIIR